MADARRQRREYWAGAGALVLAIVVLLFDSWPVPDRVAGGSVLETIFRDRVLVGMLRLAIAVMAMYSMASVPALVVGGRWAKGLGTSGIVADDVRVDLGGAVAEAHSEIAVLKMDVSRLTKERDELANLAAQMTLPD